MMATQDKKSAGSIDNPRPLKHGHRFIALYLAVIMAALVGGAIYEWQHKKVTDLESKLTNSQEQLADREKALASYPNVLKETVSASTDLLAFLGGDNTQCYKAGDADGYYDVVKEVNGNNAKMIYGCTDDGKAPSGSPTYILAVKENGVWKLVSPTGHWTEIKGVQYPSCGMLNSAKISKQLEPQCFTGIVNPDSATKIQANTNP